MTTTNLFKELTSFIIKILLAVGVAMLLGGISVTFSYNIHDMIDEIESVSTNCEWIGIEQVDTYKAYVVQKCLEDFGIKNHAPFEVIKTVIIDVHPERLSWERHIGFLPYKENYTNE